jgi:phospholipase C
MMRRALLAVVVSGCALLAASTAPATAESTTPPIQHLVVIMEENSTFDHTFGTLHGVDGLHVEGKVTQAGGDAVRLRGFSDLGPRAFHVPKGEEVLSNGPTAASTAFNDGRMDGFVRAQGATDKNARLSFTLIDRATPSPWRKLAKRGVVFDRYFSSYLAGSLPNTLSLVAGDAYGRDQGSNADFTSLWHSDIPTLFDRATEAGVSWKYYVGGLEQIHQRKVANGSYAGSADATPSALYWAPILSMQRFWTDPALAQNVRSQADLFADAASGSLPAITYVLPQPTTHEPLVLGPDLRLLSIVNAIETSPTWESTAVVVVWDDWGGYYDHVAPPVTADGQQLGMRVPMLLLSPWAQGGTVSHQTLDHSSIPALATSLFGLDPIDPHTAVPNGPWLSAPVDDPRILGLSHSPPYEAAGMTHAHNVFGLYLLTMFVIVGVLGWLGFSMLRKPVRGGSA